MIDPEATHWPDLEELREEDIARRPGRFVGGRNAWIAQTYLRLRPALEERGWDVTTGARFVPGTVSIVHRDDANRFRGEAASTFMVVVRADRAPVRACDLAIAQNALALGPGERFVPLWPQPGLKPRLESRGATLECIAYQGRTSSAPAWFRDEGFHRALALRDMRFDVRERGWEDYRRVDVALAMRDEAPRVLATKPASKLYNAWLASVPMIAAPEPAYLELRRRPLDFMQARGPADVLAAIDALRSNPHRYAAMVANGRQRGAEFDVDATRRRWLDLLEREVAPRFLAARERLASRPAWFFRAMALQRADSRLHKLAIRRERRLQQAL